MKKLKPGIDPVALMKAVKQCDGDVFFLTKNDQLDLKSVLSQYVFISLLAHTSPESSGLEWTKEEDYAQIAAFLA